MRRAVFDYLWALEEHYDGIAGTQIGPVKMIAHFIEIELGNRHAQDFGKGLSW
jgi:hypothetical protein